jgi:hypothetical protein
VFADPPALSLERTIPLGDVKGRIDHLAVDLEHQRLFIAELGNDTVGVIDLRSHLVRQRLVDLDEPQGLATWPPRRPCLWPTVAMVQCERSPGTT